MNRNCRLLVLVMWLILGTSVVDACPQLALAPHTQWKLETQHGVSWLVTPCGDRFFSIGVNVVNGGYPRRLYEGRVAYHWGTFYPNLETWSESARRRLLEWGFNTAGAWSLDLLRLPVIPNLELGRLARFHWFDPFDPATDQEMRTWAHKLVAPYKGSPHRIGYFSDNEVGWWNGALFTYYLKQRESHHTKRRLVALLRGHYGDDWESFSRDFLPPPGVASFTALLHSSGATTQLRPGGEGIHLIRRWTAIEAEHYYRLLHRALREADPRALIFADRLQIYYDPDAVRAMAPYVDAVATNYNVDGADGWIARYYFDGLRHLTGNKPILVSEWFFAAHENRSGNLNNGHLMTVHTQAERARGAAAAAQRLAREPQIVGLHWFQYYDHPKGGRPDGEDYNFGLVDIDDRPYDELTEAFRRVNPRLPELHQRGRLSASTAQRAQFAIPEADIDPRDRSLDEWPKDHALVPGLMAPVPEVVFGDLYLTWSRAGLSLATISMDYFDFELLAYGGAFPLEEAFRVEWGVDAGAGPHRFALYFVPSRASPRGDTSSIGVHLCQMRNATCAPVPFAVTTHFGGGIPRLTAEVLLPWSAMGMSGPPSDKQLHMELTATSFHRARWMSWSGLLPEVALRHPARWQLVKLGPRAPSP